MTPQRFAANGRRRCDPCHCTEGRCDCRPDGGLAVRGKLIVVAVPDDLMPINALPIVFGERSILGSLTGKAIDNQETLDFSVLQNVRPMIETVPLERAAEAYAKMMAAKPDFEWFSR